MKQTADILLIEDDPGDIELTRRALMKSTIEVTLHVVTDGISALNYLRRRPPYSDAVRPDAILLDLNMPRMDGAEVLRQIKTDPSLRTIPVIVLTTSEAESDVTRCYDLGANCFITKPIGFEAFLAVMKSIVTFWFTVVTLPRVRKEMP